MMESEAGPQPYSEPAPIPFCLGSLMNPVVFHIQQAWIALTGAGLFWAGWCGHSKVRPTRASPTLAEEISVMQCLCVVLLSQKL